ncbi:hypothetical protein GOP47_0006826 [Adiantum capillus-veneris]|uniref:Pentatricopeptide repeat-containing protein n=1 Tax=Adiantum capillus-veneris TaxID=13818 RepID=A0A9D4V3M2_ADICA|nr:hypothetical protein GOP47_0006826 [Adiantum capillus-veneris]
MLSLAGKQLATPAASDWENELPSIEDLLSSLHRCCVKRDFAHARLLHVRVCHIGLEAHEVVGNHLVPVYVACGSLQAAQQAFYHVNLANEHSWTSLIQGYAEYGELKDALTTYTQMQNSSLQPNSQVFIALLKACSVSRCLDYGYELHLNVVKEDFCHDLYVGNTLVAMYAKLGLILESKDVLHEMPLRDVVSWSALMAAYNEHGYYTEALQCLKLMQLDGVQPNGLSFMSALKACSTLGDMEKGQELHDEVVMKGFEEDSFVVNTLIDFYGSNGFLPEALQVFNKVDAKDTITWNSLITVYSKHGLEEDALLCARRMESDGASPVPITFILTLKVCGSKGALGDGRAMHLDAVKRGFEKLPTIGNSLVDMYVKCGSISESQDVFDKLEGCQGVSWNILMSGFAEHGFYDEALYCLEKMQLDGVCPDVVSFVCALHVCSCTKTIHRGQHVHMQLTKMGLEGDVNIGNTLVDMYAKLGLIIDCQNTFDTLSTQGVVSWNTLITGYVDSGQDEESLGCLQHMRNMGVCPDTITFISSLGACGRLGCIDIGQELHSEAVKKGFEKDSFVDCSLVDVYAKCGFLEEASGILESLHNRDVVCWTSLIAGYANQGLCGEALECFQQMQLEHIAPDVASWNAVISGYVEQEEPVFALQLYAQMLEQALLPNMTTFIGIFKALGNMTALSLGWRLHAVTCTLYADEIDLAYVLIDMYNKCGSIADAQRVFQKMPSKNPSIWNALITAHAQRGDYNGVFYLLEGFKKKSLQPDEITFLGLLSVCSHAGLLDKGKDSFLTMIEQHPTIWTIKHCSSIVDLFTRAGHFAETLEFLQRMPFEPDYALWCTLLGTCWRWGNIRLGKQLFDCAVRLSNNRDSVFLMFNMYVDAQMWE